MLEEITRLQQEGHYERALGVAKRTAIDHLKHHRRNEAADLLIRSAEILCRMNHPGKARSFAMEAIDLASRGDDLVRTAHARGVTALALLRLGELEKAQRLLDTALEILNASPEDPRTISAQLVAAELSIVREEYDEARIFAEDALHSAREIGRGDLQAEALLAQAICEDRTGRLPNVLELLSQAEEALQDHDSPHVSLLIETARAKAQERNRQPGEANASRARAKKLIDLITGTLGHDLRERFLHSPAVLTARGEEPASKSSFWKVPLQISEPPKKREDPEPPSSSSVSKLRSILDIIKKLNSELNLRKLITIILDTMIPYCNAQRGTILIFEGEKFKVEVSRDRHGKNLKRFQMGLSRTVLRQVRDRGKMIVLDDAQETPTLRIVDSIHEQNLMSVLCVPLRVKTRLVGAVYLDNPHVTGAFGKEEIGYAEILTDHAAVAIDNALLHIKAIHDGLTGLFNHSHFEKRIDHEVSRARRHGRPCGLIMLDVDDFKEINDRHGHEAGNQILREVSRFIGTAVRNIDMVARIQERDPAPVIARYGGDEFEVLLPETDMEGLTSTAKRIQEGLQGEKFIVRGKEIPVTFSVGAALFPDHAPDARELALRADDALYQAKSLGKNRFQLYGKAESE